MNPMTGYLVIATLTSIEFYTINAVHIGTFPSAHLKSKISCINYQHFNFLITGHENGQIHFYKTKYCQKLISKKKNFLFLTLDLQYTLKSQT